MKQIVIISGKGGTGKTTFTSFLAEYMSSKCVIADCDVEAPNLHITLSPIIEDREDIATRNVAVIDENRCMNCDECLNRCAFGAIEKSADGKISIISEFCEGCGVCELICRQEAVTLKERTGAVLKKGKAKQGPFFYGHLKIGEEASGRVVTRVKYEAQAKAISSDFETLLIDGSPGTGCPVIASLTGADAALIVTEPTVSALHDLKRILDVTDHFGIDACVCLNKTGLNIFMESEILDLCRKRKIPFVGNIPYSAEIVDLNRNGKPAYEAGKELRGILTSICDRLFELLYSN